jgi:hypothetical protein
MSKLMSKWLKIYPGEIGLFLWSTLLLFLIRSSNVLFNNFAETAFLKRFGVEYLPLVYMVNAISTFFIMGVLTGVMGRLPGSRLLTYLLVFCGSSVAGLRLVIPIGFDLLYPVLFILKTQYEVLLGLVFWNLANDLFNTRQSKRLFPLITVGGVFGGIIGSFGSPLLAKGISLDNLMVAYLVPTVFGAMAVKKMGTRFPTLLLWDKKTKKVKKQSSLLAEFKKVLPFIKESKLAKILIMLTLMPNVVIPIINYQFNFAVDQTYATEGGMFRFFAYFRGAMNVISLVVLLFASRVYGRWGLPVALMFHPFNYLLAFASFLLRFDIFSAMYARISTNVLRNTINNPARAALMGLVPASHRPVVRPFLRGTVVRIGILLGSGFIILSEEFIHPRYLSLVAFLFVSAWIVSTFFLKRWYAETLLDLISRNMLDLKSMEEKDVGHVFKDKKTRSQLLQALLSTHGDDCLWYARLLKSLGDDALDSHILSVLKGQDDKTKIGLLSLLSPKAGEAAVEAFRELDDPGKPDLTIALIKAVNRLPAELSSGFNAQVFETSPHPEVRAHAVIGLYEQDPQRYNGIVDSWLESDHIPERNAGVIAAGASGDKRYVSKLVEMLDREEGDIVLPHILDSLQALESPEVNTLVFPYLSHSSASVRLAALAAFSIDDDDGLRSVIALMDDPSEPVGELAKEKLEASPYLNAQVLVESLNIPGRKIREGIFDLLESLNVKDLDVFRFARTQLEGAYQSLAEAEALRHFPGGWKRDLLIDHLGQKKDAQLENIIRVIAAQDRSGQMRIIWRGISSSDARQRSNSLEALDDVLAPPLSRIFMPILEDIPVSQCLEIGRKNFDLPDLSSNETYLYSHLLVKDDWVTVMLTLYLIASQGLRGLDAGPVRELAESENIHIRQMAQCIVNVEHCEVAEEEDDMDTKISITDKILHLRGIHIFEGLSVSELAAVASVAEVVVYPKDQVVIKEGEPGDTMYLIIKGEVMVIKDLGQVHEIELDSIGAGDYFGEMALFESEARSASIRTLQESRLLVLHKREFSEIVREYPQIALHICKAFSHRIRDLHHKIQSYEEVT